MTAPVERWLIAWNEKDLFEELARLLNSTWRHLPIEKIERDGRGFRILIAELTPEERARYDAYHASAAITLAAANRAREERERAARDLVLREHAARVGRSRTARERYQASPAYRAAMAEAIEGLRRPPPPRPTPKPRTAEPPPPAVMWEPSLLLDRELRFNPRGHFCAKRPSKGRGRARGRRPRNYRPNFKAERCGACQVLMPPIHALVGGVRLDPIPLSEWELLPGMELFRLGGGPQSWRRRRAGMRPRI